MTLHHNTKDDQNSKPHPLKVLIVDDKKENLVALRTVLEDLDVEIIEAAGGNEALSATLDHSFAVAILDVMMPEMDGYELAGYLRGDPKTARMPIIFLTAVSRDEERIFKGYEAGAVDYIVKPYNPDILVSKVRVFLELATVHAELIKHPNHLDELVQERVKEQACLYGVSKVLLAELDLTLEERLHQAVNRIPSGWQYSTIACARLETDDQTITSRAFKESPWRLSADVVVNEEARGTVEVFYTEERPDAGLGPFLKEEQTLITSIALLLGQAIARAEAMAREKHLTAVLHSIRDVNQLIVREKRQDVLIESACDTLVRTRGFQGAWIALNGDSPEHVEAAQHGFDPAAFDELTTAFRKGELPACCKRSLEEARVVATPDPAGACQGCALAETYAGNAALTVELRHEDRCYGCLGVAVPPDFAEDEEEASLLLEIAGGIAFALHGMEVEAERKAGEEALRESEAGLRQAQSIAHLGSFRLDLNTNVIHASEEMLNIYGWAPELSGKLTVEAWQPSVHPDDLDRVTAALANTDTVGVPYNIEFRIYRTDGEMRIVHLQGELVRDPSGIPVGIMGTGLDITERKQAEEQFRQAQKMESVGRLAGGVAHDFNNKLTTILGYTELAMGTLDPSDALYGDLKQVLEAGKQSTNIVRQLLAFARKQTISPEVTYLNDTLQGIVKMLRRLIGEDIDLAWEPGADLWLIKMDPTQLDQILANLCVNAKDAIGGVGKVTVESENVVLDEAYCAGHAGFVAGEYVTLAVSDDGAGMDKETLENVFEPFFTTKEVGKGTGLGLSTLYGIVKQNNGFVNIYSEPDRGTTVKIYLPRHKGEAQGEAKPVESEIPRGHGETVLLVEDEKTVLQLGQQMLERLGYTVLPWKGRSRPLRGSASTPATSTCS